MAGDLYYAANDTLHLMKNVLLLHLAQIFSPAHYLNDQ